MDARILAQQLLAAIEEDTSGCDRWPDNFPLNHDVSLAEAVTVLARAVLDEREPVAYVALSVDPETDVASPLVGPGLGQLRTNRASVERYIARHQDSAVGRTLQPFRVVR